MDHIRKQRLERLIGTDETRGVRGDLGRARRSKAQGYMTWVDGRPIDEAIARYERTLDAFRARLTEIDGVARSAPCHVCGDYGYHADGCSEIDEVLP